MTMKKDVIVSFLAVFFLTATLFTIRATSTTTRSTGPAYDPWADVSGPTPGVPDGIIDMMDLGYEGSRFLTTGTPMDRSNLMSVAYDSGWVDITGMCGQYFNITHNLGTTDVMVDIQGKTTLNGGIHQRYLGLTNYIPGWSRTYGGTGDDWANALVRTSDGGYALAGYTSSFGVGGSYDGWLVKTDSTGNIQWNKTYGGTGYDVVSVLIQTSDGGYALAGYTMSFGAGSADSWLVKTDSTGNMQWNKTYGGTGGDVADALVRTSDGGYALAGYTSSFGAGSSYDGWLVKTDSTGNALWNKTYGGTGDDEACALVQTSDGGYAVAGYTTSLGAGSRDSWLVKTNASGDMQWNKTYGGTGVDAAYALVQTSDGGYALAGYTSSFGAGGYDGWLVKTDANGNMQWNKTYGGTGGDLAHSLVQTGDGGYALAGYTNSFGAGGYDGWLLKTDVEQGLAWVDSTSNTVTLYRGETDPWWNFVRVQIWTHG